MRKLVRTWGTLSFLHLEERGARAELQGTEETRAKASFMTEGGTPVP